MRIGLISDSHISRSGELWPQVFDVLQGVDAILHAGDLWSPVLLDELAEIAPVWAARGNGDMHVTDARVQDTWMLDFERVSVAMIHDFPSPQRASAEILARRTEQRFPGATPDVVIYGHTHIDEADSVDGILYVNPGSPTLPYNKALRLGTIGFLHIDAGKVMAELHQLTETGSTPIHRAEVPRRSRLPAAGSPVPAAGAPVPAAGAPVPPPAAGAPVPAAGAEQLAAGAA